MAEAEVQSVRAAVDLAVIRFAGTLTFLKTALTSADESPYGQPEKVLQALEAMDDVCKDWRRSMQLKESIGPLDESLRPGVSCTRPSSR